MIERWKIKQLAFFLLSGAFLVLACISISPAAILFSTDIPVKTGSASFDERDIVEYDDPDFSKVLTGSELGIEKGVNLDAFGIYENDIFFSVDIPTRIDGDDYTEHDLILYDGSTFSKLLDGEAVGIPRGGPH